MRAFACVAFLAAASAASSPAQVRAVTCLSEAAVRTADAAVRTRLPDVEVVWTRQEVAALWDGGSGSLPLDADLLAGVDAQVLELLAAGGGLAQLGVALPVGSAPFHVDPGGSYLVPWADAYVVAHDPAFTDGGVVPRTLETMAEARFADRLVVPAPEAAPSLFVEWIRGPLRAGEPLDSVFALLGTVDARVRAWSETGEAAVLELSRRPEETFAVGPLSAVRASAGLGFEPLEPFVPLQGLGIAIPSGSAAPAAARQVAEALLDPSVAYALAVEHGLLPGIRVEPEGAAPVPAFLRDLVARAAPVDPDREWVRAWFRRFDADVRGKGRYSEGLGLLLDVVFTLLFVTAMFWIYRRSQVADS